MIRQVIDQELTIYGAYCQHIQHLTPRVVFEGKEPPPRREVPEKTEASLARTRMNVFRLISCNVNAHGPYIPTFVTLTYARNEQNRKVASRELRYYHMRLAYEVGLKLKYIAIPEFQKRGAIHYHVVYFNLPFISSQLLEQKWGQGGTNIKSLKSVRKIAGYISKYVTKESIDSRHAGSRLLITSQGLLRPTTYINQDVDQQLDTLYLTQESKQSSHNKIITTYVNSSKGSGTRRN